MELGALGLDLIVLCASHHFRLHLKILPFIGRSEGLDLIAFHVWQVNRLKVWRGRREPTHLQSRFVKVVLIKTEALSNTVGGKTDSFCSEFIKGS